MVRCLKHAHQSQRAKQIARDVLSKRAFSVELGVGEASFDSLTQQCQQHLRAVGELLRGINVSVAADLSQSLGIRCTAQVGISTQSAKKIKD